MEKLSKEDLSSSHKKEDDYPNGCLYLIATPIGNFDDITLRAIKLLSFVDLIVCEDTRKTKKLLSALKINYRKLISYNDHNASKKRPYIINQLLINKSIGLVSDAGTPLISDPGYKLVNECYINNIPVTHSPGPSSVINALVLSNLPSDQFFFGGFLPSHKNNKKKKLLQTKYNQSISSILLKRIEKNIPLKGEVVIVIEGHKPNTDIDLEAIKKDIADKLINFSLRDTVNMIVVETGLSKKIVYNEAIEINNKKS